jgi:hypothetical protein
MGTPRKDGMRTAGFFLLLLVAAPAAAQTQTPLIAIAPSPGPVLGPRTVIPALVACTDLPVSEPPSSPLQVLAPYADDLHEFSYRNDVVVLSGGTPQGLQPGQRFFTRRFRTPRNGEATSEKDRGSVRTSGWLTVIAADEHSALARIDYACDSVWAGDYLEPYVEPVLPQHVAPDGRTDFSGLAHVLAGIDRRESFGAGDILSIDRGASQAVAVGTRVVFYRDRLNGTPLVELGAGIVIEVSAETSKVVLDRARFAVVIGDYVAFKQP